MRQRSSEQYFHLLKNAAQVIFLKYTSGCKLQNSFGGQIKVYPASKDYSRESGAGSQ